MTAEDGANKRAFLTGSNQISISTIYVCFEKAALLNVLRRKAVIRLELDSWPKLRVSESKQKC